MIKELLKKLFLRRKPDTNYSVIFKLGGNVVESERLTFELAIKVMNIYLNTSRETIKEYDMDWETVLLYKDKPFFVLNKTLRNVLNEAGLSVSISKKSIFVTNHN